MALRVKVPKLADPRIVVRLAADKEEVELANNLLFRRYVETGFWDEDGNQMRTNKFLYADVRRVVIILDNDRVVGTMSIIVDSDAGLPSDSPQPTLMRELRSSGAAIAEVSAFAIDQSKTSRKLFFFLMSYVLQYSFYYAGIDRLVASCGSEHAKFYESALCFSRLSAPTYYAYTRDIGALISLDLREAHHLLAQKYPTDPSTGESLYRFLMCDPQPCQHFGGLRLKRPRDTNWLALSLEAA